MLSSLKSKGSITFWRRNTTRKWTDGLFSSDALPLTGRFEFTKNYSDKVGKDNKEAADKFKEISEAYQVLSDIELRKKYNAEGKAGLSADRTDINDGPGKIDPAMLFAFLFGSDKFGDYFGRLAMATSALVADSPKIGLTEARTVQTRRVTRLAFKLAERVRSCIRLLLSCLVLTTSMKKHHSLLWTARTLGFWRLRNGQSDVWICCNGSLQSQLWNRIGSSHWKGLFTLCLSVFRIDWLWSGHAFNREMGEG